MIVYNEHIREFTDALRAETPLVVLPAIHPEYIRRLVLAWAQTREPRPLINLFEPGVGRNTLQPSDHQHGGIFRPSGGASTPSAFLRDFLEDIVPPEASTSSPDETVLWIGGSEAVLADPTTVAQLAAICRRICAYGLALHILIDAPVLTLPASLQIWSRELDFNAPRLDNENENEGEGFIKSIIRRTHPKGDDLLPTLSTLAPGQSRPPLEEIVRQLRGLDAAAINLSLATALSSVDAAAPGAETQQRLIESITRERGLQLKRASGLQVVPNTFSEGDLQGMNRYQRHLDYVKVLFDDAIYSKASTNGPRPRGVLLVGLPGCGKSLAARLTANKLDVPLLRMDVGRMMGRYLGESEDNLRRALDAAEAAAPCVLWVDEIEKTIGSLGPSSEGSGTGLRMLGDLLTWMQEHQSQVYIFATANRVDALPPELLRRGRFDELWCVKLPTTSERKEMLRAKLRRLHDELDSELNTSTSDALKDLIKKTKGYTGADIESLIQEAWMRARVLRRKVDSKMITSIIADGFSPMSRQFSEEIGKIKNKLNSHGFKDVNCKDKLLPEKPDSEQRSKPLTKLQELWTSRLQTTFTFKFKPNEEKTTLIIHPGHSLTIKRNTDTPQQGTLTQAQDGTRLYVQTRGADDTKAKPLIEYLIEAGSLPNTLCIQHHDLRTEIGTDDIQHHVLNDWPLQRTSQTHINLSGQNINDACFGRSTITHANLQNAILRNCDFTRADLRHANLTHARITAGCYDDIDLRHSSLESITIQSSANHQVSLIRAAFQDATLTRAHFQGANLQGANFQGATLKDATFETLSPHRTNLTSSDFRKAKMGCVRLLSANLKKAKLQHADLRSANLQGADLQGANLQGADLRGAILNRADFQGALYDRDTQWPGSPPPEAIRVSRHEHHGATQGNRRKKNKTGKMSEKVK